MAVSISGEFVNSRPPEELYDFLCDPHKFGPLLPDFESMAVEDARHFTVRVRVSVGNIRGSAEIRMELAEAVRPSRAVYRGAGTVAGSVFTVSSGFDLTAVPQGTRIAWRGESEIAGKLAVLAGGMLEPVARQNIQKLMDSIRWALTSPAAEPAALPSDENVTQEPSRAADENFRNCDGGPEQTH